MVEIDAVLVELCLWFVAESWTPTVLLLEFDRDRLCEQHLRTTRLGLEASVLLIVLLPVSTGEVTVPELDL